MRTEHFVEKLEW